MEKLIQKIFVVGCLFLFIIDSNGQVWHLKRDILETDSVLKIYNWETTDEYHGAYGELILFKDGKFKYSAHYPGNNIKYSDGLYIIKDNILELKSFRQKDNVNISINYIDTLVDDPHYKRISFPVNILGERIFDGFYFFNFDTSIVKAYFPKDPTDRIQYDKIRYIKVCFNRAEFKSKWIEIKDNTSFIQVRVLTEKNFDDYTPKIINNWRFEIKGYDLIEL